MVTVKQQMREELVMNMMNKSHDKFKQRYSSATISAMVANISEAVAPVWPLNTFIACNPLQGFEYLPFERAVSEGQKYFNGAGHLDLDYYRAQYHAGYIDKQQLQHSLTAYLKPFPEVLSIGQQTVDVKRWCYRYVMNECRPSNMIPDMMNKLNLNEIDADTQPAPKLSVPWRDRQVMTKVNWQTIKWCTAFLDEGQATLPMPEKQLGFYQAWRQLAPFDHTLHNRQPAIRKWLQTLPMSAISTLLHCLTVLGIESDDWEVYLKQSLTELPGWAGFIKWREDQSDYLPNQLAPITIMDYLAIRLTIECAVLMQITGVQSDELAAKLKSGYHQSNHDEERHDDMQPANVLEKLWQYSTVDDTNFAQLTQAEFEQWRQVINHIDRQMIWLGAAERSYQMTLLPTLNRHPPKYVADERPAAQIVFCIDVRSEPFRRSLEAQGQYETFGFAGFFGLPIRFHPYGNQQGLASCPVLLKPRHDVYEQINTTDRRIVKRHQIGKRLLNSVNNFYKSLKHNIATPFALVESFGAWFGLIMLGRTLLPNTFIAAKRMTTEQIMPTLTTTPKFNPKTSNTNVSGMTKREQLMYAEVGLRMMGLTDRFAKIIVLCGHGSTTENNPYASALDCGACGGNHGGPNAKVMAEILNDNSVRQQLNIKGIVIPEDTCFVGAEHDTTTDEVILYSLTDCESKHPDLCRQLQHDLRQARVVNNTKRIRTFPDYQASDKVIDAILRRSRDWAQVRPEWGLAKNAAFIVGPRWLTQGGDLHGQCFLHSYNWEQDDNNDLLTTILTAPMVVAQWINSQYYFSAVDNVAYGSGSKVTHNVVGKIGVMQGNASDLMHGLNLQSIAMTDDDLYHVPRRLMTVVYAPRAKLSRVIERNDILKKLFFNGWVSLVALSPDDHNYYHLLRDGSWTELNLTDMAKKRGD
jgi:uncharacterized protein YbcC (UPF0753/DUF2309 family)